MNIKDLVSEASSKLLDGYSAFTSDNNPVIYPNTESVVRILEKLRAAIFPGHFGAVPESKPIDIWLQSLLADVFQELTEEIEPVLPESNAATKLIGSLAEIQQLLHKDAQAGFDGDPAARCVDEVILTYPGFYAVFIHRIAHILFLENVPFIPRIMSEYAHSITGIDIHPGAKIGESFFIDHGTGVVIGETTIIGNNVKIYQGVTLGALSTKSGQKLAGKKRHPTIEDNVTIYSGASILGGETVIGKDSTIGGNGFITASVPQHSTVKGI